MPSSSQEVRHRFLPNWMLSELGILFTGQFPRPMFDYLVGVLRWGYRVGAYVAMVTDVYPPFSLT